MAELGDPRWAPDVSARHGPAADGPSQAAEARAISSAAVSQQAQTPAPGAAQSRSATSPVLAGRLAVLAWQTCGGNPAGLGPRVRRRGTVGQEAGRAGLGRCGTPAT